MISRLKCERLLRRCASRNDINYLMIDLCSGLKGASAAMKNRGWEVRTVDINPEFKPDIVSDVVTWSWNGRRPDLIWASPPCDEFAKESMPWTKTGKEPSMKIVNACKRIIKEANPRNWVIENVRGAVKFLGEPGARIGPFYLWGYFPPISEKLEYRKKESFGSHQKEERAKIPYVISERLAIAIESQLVMELTAKSSEARESRPSTAATPPLRMLNDVIRDRR